MQTLGIEGEKDNVRVNRLAPTAATAMTDGVLAADALAHLAPEAVSPGLLALVGDDAPTRAILCAGAGHFAAAHVTLTGGLYVGQGEGAAQRSEEHTSELQSLMRISYAVFCLKKNKRHPNKH